MEFLVEALVVIVILLLLMGVLYLRIRKSGGRPSCSGGPQCPSCRNNSPTRCQVEERPRATDCRCYEPNYKTGNLRIVEGGRNSEDDDSKEDLPGS